MWLPKGKQELGNKLGVQDLQIHTSINKIFKQQGFTV